MGDFYEKYLRFGLALSQKAILKKSGVDYEQLLRAVFSCFQGQKKKKSKKLHKIKVRKL